VDALWVELGAHDCHMVAQGQFAAQTESVDFGPRAVPGQEVVNGVQDTQVSIIAPVAPDGRSVS
jgi:hypothetical protein